MASRDEVARCSASRSLLICTDGNSRTRRAAGTALGCRANEHLRLAVVGMAGYGAYHGFAEAIHTCPDVGFAVTCDVDLRKVKRVYDLWEQRAAQWAGSDNEVERKAAAEHYGPLAAKKPPLFADFRRMFDQAADQFDAAVVATPDHTIPTGWPTRTGVRPATAAWAFSARTPRSSRS